VAAYVSTGTEPRTGRLLATLAASGVRVLLPVLLADGDLDWAAYDGPSTLGAGLRGTTEPIGPRLGTSAVTQAQAVVVPALAVGSDGTRLGRGGGSYDRALARIEPSCLTVAFVYDGELLERVPAEPHDRRVAVAVTPSTVRYSDPG
jgi:5-formyltetrahydrofolate cyclo-ligase